MHHNEWEASGDGWKLTIPSIWVITPIHKTAPASSSVPEKVNEHLTFSLYLLFICYFLGSKTTKKTRRE